MISTRTKARLTRLEDDKRSVAQRNLRVFIRRVAPIDTPTELCLRVRLPNGGVQEVIMLEGPVEQMSEQELEDWIARQPIVELSERRR